MVLSQLRKGQSDYTKLTAALPSHMASKATVRVDSLISQKGKKYQRVHMRSFLRLDLQEVCIISAC